MTRSFTAIRRFGRGEVVFKRALISNLFLLIRFEEQYFLYHTFLLFESRL